MCIRDSVLTDQLLKNVLQRLDASERLLKWIVDLSQCDLTLEARRVIKAQTLVDCLAKNVNAPSEMATTLAYWNLYVDSSSTKDRSGVYLIIGNPWDERHEHALKFMFKASKNDSVRAY